MCVYFTFFYLKTNFLFFPLFSFFLYKKKTITKTKTNTNNFYAYKYEQKNHQQQQLQIANIETDMCLDSAGKPDDMQGAVDPYKCHGQGGNQVLFISFFFLSFFPFGLLGL